MPTFFGVVVGYDDFLPSSAPSGNAHEFHIVAQEDVTGRWVRIRTMFGATPLRLSDFGDGARLEDVRGLLAIGSRITFPYGSVSVVNGRYPNFDEMDVCAISAARIERVGGQLLRFPRSNMCLKLVHSV